MSQPTAPWSTGAGVRPPPKLALVVPCYNEQPMLPIAVAQLGGLLHSLVHAGELAHDSFVLFIDDGSMDATWALIEQAVSDDAARFGGLRLAHNAGHQAALLAGLEYVAGRCDASISLDADLQDDLSVVSAMVQRYREGAELVLGVRDKRESDSWFKRTSAKAYYRSMRWMGVDLHEDHADYRLLSARALGSMLQFSEVNLFLRGIVPLLHRRRAVVHYARQQRGAGVSKYPLRKMLSLACTGITSFSTVPLRAIMYTGALIFVVSLAMALYALWGVLTGKSVAGWASIVIPLYLLGGMLMLSVGVVGEYLARVFLETKRRPRYLIDETIGAGGRDVAAR